MLLNPNQLAPSLPFVPCRPVDPANLPEEPGESAAIIGDPYVSPGGARPSAWVAGLSSAQSRAAEHAPSPWAAPNPPRFTPPLCRPALTCSHCLCPTPPWPQVRGFDRDWFEFAGEPGGVYTLLTTGDGAQLDATFAAGGLRGQATFVRALQLTQVGGGCRRAGLLTRAAVERRGQGFPATSQWPVEAAMQELVEPLVKQPGVVVASAHTCCLRFRRPPAGHHRHQGAGGSAGRWHLADGR